MRWLLHMRYIDTMKYWQVLILGAALLGAASANDCDASEQHKLSNDFIKLEPCFSAVVTEETMTAVRREGTMENIRGLFRELCHRVGDFTTCLAGVRNRLSKCPNNDFNTAFLIVSGMMEDLLADGCDNDGDRLAHILRGIYLMVKKTDEHHGLRKCIYKFMAFVRLADRDSDVDIASESYLFHHEFAKLSNCLKYIQDDQYYTAFQWMLEKVATKMKCKHPEEDKTVPCSEIDSTKLHISDVCKLKPLPPQEDLYDFLEQKVDGECYAMIMGHDQQEGANYTDVEWLRGEYRRMCKLHRVLPTCLLEVSAYGDACLAEDVNKHYKMIMAAVDTYLTGLCVEDGAFIASIMHEMYKNAPEHDNAFRTCTDTFEEYRRKDEQHKAAAKDMQYYHNTLSYNQCVLGKLHAGNDLTSGLEKAFEDIMKKFHCVNPEDGEVVLCENIHSQHQH